VSGCDVRLVRAIGEGVSGQVHLGVSNGLFCAVKRIDKTSVDSENQARRLRDERACIIEMDHPFIAECLGSWQDDRFLYLAMEYVGGGELFSRIQERKRGGMSLDTAKFYAVEVLCALEYVHHMGYLFRDLKPENVLVDDCGHVKLVDFGFAKQAEADGRCYSQIGTPQYMAPELLQGNKGRSTVGYSASVDYWAWACMWFEMVTGKTPFFRDSQDSYFQVYLRVINGKVKWVSAISAPLKSLLKSMLVADESGRLRTLQAIKEHAYMANVQWDAVVGRRMKAPFVPELAHPGDTSLFESFEEWEAKPPGSDTGPAKLPSGVMDRHFAGYCREALRGGW
jgi:serine/threonine protein kinase